MYIFILRFEVQNKKLESSPLVIANSLAMIKKLKFEACHASNKTCLLTYLVSIRHL